MKVNAIIIGAGRSGTTSIYEYMAAHPEVNFSITKELHYFSIDDLYNRGEKYFHSLFDQNNKNIIATADTYLLMDKKAPARIKAYNPDMKIIVMMREPVARAYSNYNYSINYGHEDKNISFYKSILLEPERLKSDDIVELNNLCHCYGSLYFHHLKFWGQYFPVENLILLKLADLKKDPDKFYEQLSEKLKIAYIPFEQAHTKFNAVSGVKSKWFQQLLLNRNSVIRKVFSFVLRPFRKIIIKSGIIDKMYAINKKQIKSAPISEDALQLATSYFDQDLKMLKLTYGISFEDEPISSK